MQLVVCSSLGIQASPPQKPEKKETPVPTQLSPLQGQSVLSFSPSRTASTSPKFSPSCVPGYSPSRNSPSAPNGTGTPFSQTVAFGKVCPEPVLSNKCFSSEVCQCLPEHANKREFIIPFFRCWTTVHPLVPPPTPAALDQQKAPVWEPDIARRLQCWTPLEARRTIWRTWKAWSGSFAQKRRRVTAASWVVCFNSNNMLLIALL